MNTGESIENGVPAPARGASRRGVGGGGPEPARPGDGKEQEIRQWSAPRGEAPSSAPPRSGRRPGHGPLPSRSGSGRAGVGRPPSWWPPTSSGSRWRPAAQLPRRDAGDGPAVPGAPVREPPRRHLRGRVRAVRLAGPAALALGHAHCRGAMAVDLRAPPRPRPPPRSPAPPSRADRGSLAGGGRLPDPGRAARFRSPAGARLGLSRVGRAGLRLPLATCGGASPPGVLTLASPSTAYTAAALRLHPPARTRPPAAPSSTGRSSSTPASSRPSSPSPAGSRASSRPSTCW